ncbi:MAG: hypothetical protein AB8G11_24515 [Saprospiraceae bacterium]
MDCIKICLIGLVFVFLVSCTANKTATNHQTTEKLSISEKLKDNNHLPIEERIALYHQLKKKQPNTYNFEEKELKDYAYELLNTSLQEEAIEIFKLNIEQFPNSGEAYENLSDGYNNLSYKYRELAKASREQANDIWSVLDMKDDWGTEIFHFPIRFAKDIDYQGIEDARFPKGWSDTTSSYFWTYLFGWNIDLTTELTTNDLEKNMKLYFDGLMMSVNRDESIDPKITLAKFEKMNNKSFQGTVRIYDAFTTKRPLTLNVLVDYDYCESKKTAQILFHFSPKEFKHQVWEVLKMAKFQKTVCES